MREREHDELSSRECRSYLLRVNLFFASCMKDGHKTHKDGL